MNNPALRLYADSIFVSPYAMSVFVGLREKGIEFELIALDLEKSEQRTPHFAQLSLTQRVPTLVQGEFALSESTAITEYLEETFPQVAIYPQDRMQRAKARQIQAWLRSDLLDIRAERSTLVVFYGQQAAALSPAAQLAVSKLFAATQALLADGREYVFGTWSIVDVDLALMLNRLILNGDAVPAELVAYAQHQWQRPAIQEWVKLPRPTLD